MDDNLIVPKQFGLENPGDIAVLRVTKTRRKVATVSLDNGKQKYSLTQYQNGTVVKTETIKP